MPEATASYAYANGRSFQSKLATVVLPLDIEAGDTCIFMQPFQLLSPKAKTLLHVPALSHPHVFLG